MHARAIGWRYAGIVATTLIAISVAYWYFCWGPVTSVLLVRHAERQGTADSLSAAGIARAQLLAHMMEKSAIAAIYTSDANRTQQTAAPTASLLALTPVVINANDVSALVGHVRANHWGQKLLTVGHSNTVPQIIAAFGGPAVTITDDEFDNLYVLTVCRCRWRSVRLLHLQYGEPSP
jgi:broad specificity phosphatase PhoE